jgi:ectoine hydroxylase-related dioxygenase (phytanoyl-CoA dioxygenase family)
MANWPYFEWPNFEVTVSSMFALSDFSRENGATVVAPGSHLWEDGERLPEPQEVTQAVMSAGSVLLYLGNTMHGAGWNRNESEWRRGMHISFVLGWLRPEENSNIAVPLEVARKLPQRAQQLLGYHSYHAAPSVLGGSLGLVDVRDASEWLDPGAAPPFGSRSD